METRKPELKTLKDLRKGKVGCFSPEAMMITMLIEFIGAIWVAARYRLNKVGWLTVGLLVFLGTFQLAEFVICENLTLKDHILAQIGYMSITMLPPLGVSLAMAIAKKKSMIGQIIMYVLCFAFVIYWGFFQFSIDGEKCYGNYVFIEAGNDAMWLYGTYYYVFLAIGTVLSLYWSFKTDDKRQAWALRWLTVGYVVFILPTIVVSLVDPHVDNSIPSVMCGFAVMLALVLIFAVIPLAGTKRPWGASTPDDSVDDGDDDASQMTSIEASPATDADIAGTN